MALTPLSGINNGPTPLQPLQGYVDPTPMATPEQRSGDSVDPRHAVLGEQARPYPWESVQLGPHGPFGPENQMLGQDAYTLLTLPGGDIRQDPTGDYQPRTHAAPWPKGVETTGTPDAQAGRLIESASIHASDTNNSRRELYQPTADPVHDTWLAVDVTTGGSSIQEPVPGQIASRSGGWGHSDRVQSQAGQNRWGFDMAHVFRRFAQSPIPGNHMWMQPQSRAMVSNLPHAGRPAVGDFSPFTGQDTGQAFGTQGAVLTTLPAEYVAPTDPALQSPYPVNYGQVPASSGASGWVLT